MEPYTLKIKSDEFSSTFRLIPERESDSFISGRLEQEVEESLVIKGKFREENIEYFEYSEHNLYLYAGRTKIEINETYHDKGTGKRKGNMKIKRGFFKWDEIPLTNLSLDKIFEY